MMLKAVAPDVAILPSYSIRHIKPVVDRALVQMSPSLSPNPPKG